MAFGPPGDFLSPWQKPSHAPPLKNFCDASRPFCVALKSRGTHTNELNLHLLSALVAHEPEQPPLLRRLRQIQPCHMKMTEMRAASSLPENRQPPRTGLDVQVALGALTLPPCVLGTACLRVVGPELLAHRLLCLVLAFRSALVVTKVAARTRPRQALAGPRLMGEPALLHRIRCIAYLAELLHLVNRAWARWRFSERVIATARAPAGARTILPLPQGARVERDVHRGAYMDRRAIAHTVQVQHLHIAQFGWRGPHWHLPHL